MQPFKKIKSKVTILDKVNVDTDQIIPKQFLKLIQKSGFGKFLFYNWRYDEKGNLKNDFILNKLNNINSKILITGDNFGCGSSREHAVWALMDFGFAVVIAPSFADIFYSNCFKNGLLPIKLDTQTIEKLHSEKNEIEIDLENQKILTNSGTIKFYIESHKKKILLEGLDEISQTFNYEKEIQDYENKTKVPSLL